MKKDGGDSYWGDKHRPFVPIGTDPDELAALADAIVRGASIAHAEIADLRALIEAMQAHPDARLAKMRLDGKPTIKDPSAVTVHGGEVQSCDCQGLDIDVTLSASASFAADAGFSGASFAGIANFSHATFIDVDFSRVRFASHALFTGVNVVDQAVFADAHFEDYVVFESLTCRGPVEFDHAKFADNTSFHNSSFVSGATFICTRFAQSVRFSSANFKTYVSFCETIFGEHTDFSNTRFECVADFCETRFLQKASFYSAYFGDLVDLDGRNLDLRYVRFPGRQELPHMEAYKRRDHRSAFRNLLRAMILPMWNFVRRGFGWPTVRGVGDLRILTRVSLLALILVPIVAGVWPALRVAVNRYNSAVVEAAERLDEAAGRLESAGENIDDASTVDTIITDLREFSLDWRDRFGAMTADEPWMSGSLALMFFAAVCVTLGQFLYQTRAPERVRRQDQSAFVEWMHNRYPEGAPDRDDGLRRATAALAAIARRRPDRHENFVDHHGETVWIPPTSRIDWFTSPTQSEESSPPEETASGEQDDDEPVDVGEETDRAARPGSLPQGVVPGAERARIALEKGARAEYWSTGRENLPWAWVSFVFYAIAVALLLWILVIQCDHVGEAAGWWEQDAVETAAGGAPGA